MPPVEPPQALQLPVLPSAAIDALNLLLQPREALNWQWAGDEQQVSFTAAPALPEDALGLPFSCDEQSGCLWLGADALHSLTPDLGAALQAADPAQRALLFEFAVLEAVIPVETTFASAVMFTQGPLQVPEGVAVGLRIGEHTLSLVLGPRLLQRLAEHWHACAPVRSSDWPHLTLPVALQRGWQRLEAADWAELVPGAVVMLESDMRLVVNHQHGAAVAPHGPNTLELLTPFDFDSPPRMCPMPTPPNAPLDTTTLTLVCEVGRWRLPLAQLRTLVEGSVLSVPGGQGDGVQLCVDGQVIGSGELVRIGEGLGVRVTSLAHE